MRKALLSLVLLIASSGCKDPLVGERSPPELTVYSPHPGALAEADSLLLQALAEDARGVEAIGVRLNAGPEELVPIRPGRAVFFEHVVRGLKLAPRPASPGRGRVSMDLTPGAQGLASGTPGQ